MAPKPVHITTTWVYIHPDIEAGVARVTWHGDVLFVGQVEFQGVQVMHVSFQRRAKNGLLATFPEAAEWAAEWAENVGFAVIAEYKRVMNRQITGDVYCPDELEPVVAPV